MNEMVNAYRSGNAAAAEYASPHRLVTMLFDGALERLARAIGHTERGEMQAKGESISRVVLIIDGLQASLDQGAGDGKLAGNLNELYGYMMLRLTEANLYSDVGMMTEVHQLLSGLGDAWRAIDPDAAAGGAPGNSAVMQSSYES